MPLSLSDTRFDGGPVPRLLPLPPTRRKSYDVVIVGGGGHGLATAYYLQKNHGINNVGRFEKVGWPAATRRVYGHHSFQLSQRNGD